MLEIRFLGRGGQGAVLAAELLAEAAFRDGKVPQSFPFFGVERRGAPVTAYARVSDRAIAVRGSIAEPDVLVVLERSLLNDPAATSGLRAGGWLLVNAPGDRPPTHGPPAVRVASVDASRIATAHKLGSPTQPIVNTTILGALARLTEVVTLPSLERAIVDHVPRSPEENRAACREGYEAVRVHPVVAGSGSSPASAVRPLRPLPDGPVASDSSAVLRTSSWRTLSPRIELDRCTRCNFCWKFCPDVAIRLDRRGYPVVDEEHCKGCGICAEVCPPRTIRMVAEA